MIGYDFSDCEHAKSRPDSFQRAKAAMSLGFRDGFCAELDDYLDRYGYLAKDGIELLGMTGHQGLESDMIRMTRNLRGIRSWMSGFVAFYGITDDCFAVCDASGMVYRADMTAHIGPDPLRIGFYEYVDGLFHHRAEDA